MIEGCVCVCTCVCVCVCVHLCVCVCVLGGGVESQRKEIKRDLKVSFHQLFNQGTHVLLGTFQTARLCYSSKRFSSIKVYLVGILRIGNIFFVGFIFFSLRKKCKKCPGDYYHLQHS